MIWNKPTFILVDAHQTGIPPYSPKGKISFASRATTDVERRYPQLDLEALAIDYGLRRFRFYLVGAPEVVIVTDHKPLEAIFKSSRTGSIRTERIKLRHQDIRYRVLWEKGTDNPADYLSRHATPRHKLACTEWNESMELEKTVWFINYGPYTEAVSLERIIEGRQ